MSELLKRFKKNSTIADASILEKSKFFNEKDVIQTPVPAINIALSGVLAGGLTPGHTMWAGPSKHFKTAFSLLLAKSYMDKYPDAVMIFYDTEFGSPQGYFEAFGIDTSKVWHVPIMNIEELKFDIMHQLDDIKRGEHVIILVDSIGNSASKREVDNAMKENGAEDMTRAKQLKGLFRMITPHLTIKDIPLITVNHTYDDIASGGKIKKVGGGTGSYYSADNIFIIGRQQEKSIKTGEILGYDFIVNVEKSRYVREKSKIAISVRYDGGIMRWSGLLDMALISGHVIKPKQGWYQRVNMETGEIEDKNYREAGTNNKEFWDPILNSPSFAKWVEDNYRVANGSIIVDDIGIELDEELDDIDDSE